MVCGVSWLTLAPFPDAVFDQMRSCHNAATEFLRQYWSALLPLPAGSLGGSTPNTVPKGKEARDPVKAEKMANYLRSTEKKIEAVVRTAQQSGVDPARVQAVSPLVDVLCDTDHIGISTHSGCGECGAVTRIYPSRGALVMRSHVVRFRYAHPCVEARQCVRHLIAHIIAHGDIGLTERHLPKLKRVVGLAAHAISLLSGKKPQ